MSAATRRLRSPTGEVHGSGLNAGGGGTAGEDYDQDTAGGSTKGATAGAAAGARDGGTDIPSRKRRGQAQ
jgi:hypothetical protein